MPRAPLPAIHVGDTTIALAYPPLALRISLVQSWVDQTPDGVDEAPVAVQHQLALAAVGLAWEAAYRVATTPMRAPPTTLAAHRYDFLAYGAAIAEAFDDDAIDGAALIRQADTVASAIIATVTVTPKAMRAVEETAVFSEARPGPDSAPGSSPRTDGSATRSAGMA